MSWTRGPDSMVDTLMSELLEERICVCLHEEHWHFDQFCSQCARANEHVSKHWPLDPEHWFLENTPFLDHCLKTYALERFERKARNV